jgi:serine/threonine protein phosphatase PrpC
MIPAGRAHLHVTAITHPGLRGKSNEDRFAVSAHRLSKTDRTPSLLAVIADGVGGHRAGEVAAEMAVETISRLVAQSDASQPAQILAQALGHASQLIFEQSKRDLAQIGMGTTAVCAWIIGERLYTATAGDSRLYLLRKGNLLRLTTDHTWVQEALDYGALSPEEAREHPNAHVIRRYLGSKHPLRADLRLRLDEGESDAKAEANQGLRLRPGDRLLLCSDGLTDLVEDAEILAALSAGKVNQETLDGLVALANERGGHDNITILALEMPPRPAVNALLHPSRRLGLSCLAGGSLAAAFLLLAAGLGWFLLRPGGRLGPTLTPEALPAITTPASEPQPAGIDPAQPGPASASATPSTPTSPVQPGTLPAATYTNWPTNTSGP